MDDIENKIDLLEDLVRECFLIPKSIHGMREGFGEGYLDSVSENFDWIRFRKEARGIIEQGSGYYQEDD